MYLYSNSRSGEVVVGGGRLDRVEGVGRRERAEGDTVGSTVEEKHLMKETKQRKVQGKKDGTGLNRGG